MVSSAAPNASNDATSTGPSRRRFPAHRLGLGGPRVCSLPLILSAVATGTALAALLLSLSSWHHWRGSLAGGHATEAEAEAAANATECPRRLQGALKELEAARRALSQPKTKSTGLWYAAGRDFHGPPLFPLCSMDACFNFSRCYQSRQRWLQSTEEAGTRGRGGAHRGIGIPQRMVFSYSGDGPNYFAAFTRSKWYTSSPSEACLFFVFLDSAGKHTRLQELAHWGEAGSNHVLLSFADSWNGPNPGSIGMARLALTSAWQTLMRPSFDVSMPLPRKWHAVPAGLAETPALARKYLLTFMGNRYLGPMRGRFRSSAPFRGLHNGRDVVVLSHCGGSTNARILKEHPELAPECARDAQEMRRYTYADLMNSTFGLAPAGRQASTYRFLELLSAGVIPVVVADNWKKPFDDIIQWAPCLLSFSTSEILHILPILHQMTKEEVVQRQAACQRIFEDHLSSDEKLVESVMLSLTANLFGRSN